MNEARCRLLLLLLLRLHTWLGLAQLIHHRGGRLTHGHLKAHWVDGLAVKRLLCRLGHLQVRRDLTRGKCKGSGCLGFLQGDIQGLIDETDDLIWLHLTARRRHAESTTLHALLDNLLPLLHVRGSSYWAGSNRRSTGREAHTSHCTLRLLSVGSLV